MDKTSNGRKKNVTEGNGSVSVNKKKSAGGSVTGSTKKAGSTSSSAKKTSTASSAKKASTASSTRKTGTTRKTSSSKTSDRSVLSDLAGSALSSAASSAISSLSSSSKKKKSSSNSTLKKILTIVIILAVCYFGYKYLVSQGYLGGTDESAEESYMEDSDTADSEENSATRESASESETADSAEESEASGKDSEESSVTPTVSDEPRDYYTTLKGNKKDTVTIMIYMCGTDLESNYGLATADLVEMQKATESDNVRIIIQTGGCNKWQNSVISSKTTQRYRVTNGGVSKIQDLGSQLQMTKASTLSDFIQYCKKNYEADRYMLIFWDHGGGSVSGYGYDQNYSSSGSMSLATISTALKDGGVKFDFIGFDACLMATYETAVMCEEYADYLIASEEPEPGYGWYYTDWLTMLAKNTSVSTVDLGTKIVDTYISHCASDSPGSEATLSVVDLAKLSGSCLSKFNAFALSTSEMIAGDGYSTVSKARSAAKEFSPTSKLDQIDLIHFCQKLDTTEANALVTALEECIVYNKANESNAFGLSIYFPYKRTSYLSTMTYINEQVGMDAAYNTCMKNFTTVLNGGQIVSSSSGTAVSAITGESTEEAEETYEETYEDVTSDYISDIFSSFFGTSSSSSSGGLDSILDIFGSSSTSSYDSSDSLLSSLLGSDSTSDYGSLISNLFGGSSNSSSSSASDLTSTIISGLFGSDDRSLMASRSAYYAENYLDASRLYATYKNGEAVLELTDDEWDLVTAVALNLFIADGEGYIDLGIDNTYEWNEDGDLLLNGGDTWLAVNGQIVAYYFDSYDDEEGVTRGHVPCLWNNERAFLYFTFDADGNATFEGVSFLYENETQTVAKGPIQVGQTDADGNLILKEGDTIEFICDYYDKDGNFESAYVLGDCLTFDGQALTISDVKLSLTKDQTAELTYRLTDIYNNQYWTESIEK